MNKRNKKGWTKQIYDILEILESIEKEDSVEYQEYWLLTKLARAINRFDREEALKIKNTYERLKENQNGKGER